MADFLVDCNHLSAAIRKVSTLREKIHQARKQGHKFGTLVAVLCELEAGIQQTSKPQEFRRRLSQLLKHIRLWPLDQFSCAAKAAFCPR
jgi:predicted nucleic acid-binding protein